MTSPTKKTNPKLSNFLNSKVDFPHHYRVWKAL